MDPAVQAIETVIVQGLVPEIAGVPSEQDPLPAATVVVPVVGAVHPAGTTTVTSEPVANELKAGAVKVNTNLLPVVDAITDVGDTIIVPLPLLAGVVIMTGDTGETSVGRTESSTVNVPGP